MAEAGDPVAHEVGAHQRHVLCEINVSSVAPFPDSAMPAIVAAVRGVVRGED